MTTETASPAQSLRPSRKVYRAAVRRELLIITPALVFAVGVQVAMQLSAAAEPGASAPGPVIWFFVGVVGAAVLVAVVYVRMLLSNTRIDLGSQRLTVVDWLGRSRSIDPAAIGTALEVNVRMPRRPRPMLFLLDHEGKRLLTMDGMLWPTEAMLEVGAAAPVPATTFAGDVSYEDLRVRYPQAVSWAQAHPYALAVIVAGGVCAAAFAGILAVVLMLVGG